MREMKNKVKNWKQFNESMEQKPNESTEDYLKRLFAEGDRSIANLKKIKEDMKRDGVIGFCNKCGCNRYADKEHKCEINEKVKISKPNQDKEGMGIHLELEKIILKCQSLKLKYGFSYEEKTLKIRKNFSERIKQENLIEKSDDVDFAMQLCLMNELDYEIKK